MNSALGGRKHYFLLSTKWKCVNKVSFRQAYVWFLNFISSRCLLWLKIQWAAAAVTVKTWRRVPVGQRHTLKDIWEKLLLNGPAVPLNAWIKMLLAFSPIIFLYFTAHKRYAHQYIILPTFFLCVFCFFARAKQYSAIFQQCFTTPYYYFLRYQLQALLRAYTRRSSRDEAATTRKERELVSGFKGVRRQYPIPALCVTLAGLDVARRSWVRYFLECTAGFNGWHVLVVVTVFCFYFCCYFAFSSIFPVILPLSSFNAESIATVVVVLMLSLSPLRVTLLPLLVGWLFVLIKALTALMTLQIIMMTQCFNVDDDKNVVILCFTFLQMYVERCSVAHKIWLITIICTRFIKPWSKWELLHFY